MQKVEIYIKGYNNVRWLEWLTNKSLSHSDPCETILTGILSDQAALHGVITHLRSLGIQLTPVSCEDLMD